MEKKKIALLTSGGDSPGMNCAIRAITRSLLFHNQQPIGVDRGYSGLLEGNFRPLKAADVGNILQLGGTLLRTSRSAEFATPEGRQKAMDQLKQHNIHGLIVIGGDGSYRGAHALWQEHQLPVITLPGTIDNDIEQTEYTIGHDTAVQTAMEAIDRIRDTALSHDRVFFIEVMGRNSSAIALKVGLCTGAENVIEPHADVAYQEIVSGIERGMKRGKVHSIFVVAEGQKAGRSYEIQEKLMQDYQIDSRVCILGHIQRGGSPTAVDRYLASIMGAKAVDCMLNFSGPKAIAMQAGQVVHLPLEKCLQKSSGSDSKTLQLIKEISI